jgi:hypothetical protein
VQIGNSAGATAVVQRLPNSSWLLLTLALSSADVRSEIDGPPIVDNNYNLDLRQGPVLGSSRKVALGGAYIGVGEGIASLSSNPAGVAFRPQRSTTKFDWDWTAGLTGLDSDDFDNNGETPPNYKSHRIRSLGLMGQYGSWGLGVLSESEIIALESPAADDDEYVLSVSSLTLGRQFLDRELTVGVGWRATTTKLRTSAFDVTLGKLSGTGWDVGALWNPDRGPWRFGMSYSSSIRADESLDTSGDSPLTVNGLIVPQQVILPASLGLGASYAVDSAPFWQGHKWLVAGDLLFTESSANAVGVESVLAQKIQSVGTDDTLGVRLGSELETIPGRLRLRLGTYYEPSNYAGVSSRMHVTGGFEVRMFHTSIWGDYDWSLTATVDSARDYLNVLVAIGFWYF